MHPKVILSRLLRWFAEHLLSSILSLIVAALIAAWGGIFFFSMSALDYATLILNTRTPLWATISMILLCGLYSFLAVRRRNPQKPPIVEEDLHEAFGVFWNKQYRLRCLRCKWPLKCASEHHGPSTFFCSNCDCKHVLRDQDGVYMTEARAIEQLKKVLTSG